MYPQGRRAVRLPPRIDGSPHGLPLWVDPFSCHSDGNDRRGGGSVRSVPRRSRARRSVRTDTAGFLASTSRSRAGRWKLGLSPQRLIALVSIWVLTWINLRGVREGKMVQTTLTVVKTGALAALVLLGLTIGRNADAIAANFGPGDSSDPFRSTRRFVLAFGAALVGSLFSSDAWNNVTFAAAEVKNPQRNLPLSLLLGTGLVTPALHARERGVSEHAAARRLGRRRDGVRARYSARDAGPCRYRGRRGAVRLERYRCSWPSRFSSRRSAATTG